jgi:MFS family permease
MGSSGLIAAGVFSGLEGTMGLAGWQWLFIIEACTGVFFAFIGPFFIPDFPSSDKGAGKIWLTKEQREFAKERLSLDRVSEPRAKESVMNGLRLVVTDLKTWIFVSWYCSDLGNIMTDHDHSACWVPVSPALTGSTTSTHQSSVPWVLDLGSRLCSSPPLHTS